MGSLGRIRTGCIAAVLAFVMVAPGAARAEAVSINAWYGAPRREVARLSSIAVDRFAGDDGPALALVMERALADAADRRGDAYFDVLGASRRGDRGPVADGIVSGAVTTGVEKTRFKKKIRQCPDGPKAKCKDAEEIEVEIGCNRRVITFQADIRVVRSEDGRVIYSDADPQRDEVSWCPRDSAPADAEAVIRRMIDTVATNFTTAVVPRWRQSNIRFREDRKGLAKADAETFKLALRQTKGDVAAACATWAMIERSAPGQHAVLFNLALCAEAAGDLDRAASLYRAAASRSAGKSGDINDGLSRIARRLDAIEDDRARELTPGRG